MFFKELVQATMPLHCAAIRPKLLTRWPVLTRFLRIEITNFNMFSLTEEVGFIVGGQRVEPGCREPSRLTPYSVVKPGCGGVGSIVFGA